MESVKDVLRWKPRWTVTKYANNLAHKEGKHYEQNTIEGNLLLNEGITTILNLVIGAAGQIAFNNVNSYLGVGDSSAVAAANQTGLQATTNKLYKVMDANFPTVSGQTLTFQSTFGSADANFAWNEFTAANGSSDTASNMNRKVSAQGTKVSGQTWVLSLAITLA